MQASCLSAEQARKKGVRSASDADAAKFGAFLAWQEAQTAADRAYKNYEPLRADASALSERRLYACVRRS